MTFNLRTISTLAVVASSVLITGCAFGLSAATNATMTDDAIMEATVKYFGVPAREVKVFEIEKGVLNTGYKAKVSGKLYNCYTQYGSISCKQPGS
jgi:hypothetical protein